ncbi:MAG: DUF3794 and LysM peptidoglycan-binding domain-containing protein [Cellulosilyticaceae bacterium]
MSVELIRKQLDLNEMIKKETVQVVKERDMIVPDGKADLQRVIYLDGKVNMEQIDIQADRVVYKGQIDAVILYVPENNPATVCTMKGSIPLEDFIILDGVTRDQKVDLNYRIERMHWNILNERKVNVKAILEVEVEAIRGQEMMVATEATSKSPIQVRTANLNITKPSCSKVEKKIVKDELTIPQGKSSIGEILQLSTSIKEDQVRRTDNELLFNGVVEVTTLYKAVDSDEVEVVSHRIPFAESIEFIKPDNEAYWGCELDVLPTYVQVGPDYDGEDRVVEVECLVTAAYNTFERINEKIVDDLYCPGKKVSVEESEKDYMNLASRAQVSIPKKEMVAVTDMNPENNQIYTVEIKPIIDETVVGDDKLTVKGMLEVKVVYTCKEGMNKVETAMDMLPFSQELSTPGICRKSYISAKVTPKDVNVASYNRGEVVLEYVLDYKADVYNKGTLLILEDATLIEMPKEELGSYPSVTVYLAKQGDSLWNLAKRFNTTVKDIEEINGLEENTLLNKGQKLIILKKTKF